MFSWSNVVLFSGGWAAQREIESCPAKITCGAD